MAAVLRRTAFSPNIKDRLDFSCALFDANGELYAQAAHIPVHLGSMAYAMADIVEDIDWQAGDVLALNDPYLGGTHLPDVTLVSPVFYQKKLVGFVANRAHHANIGASTPGSMPISTSLDEEGLLIPPTFLIKAGVINQDAMRQLEALEGIDVSGDFAAQISANKTGGRRLQDLLAKTGSDFFLQGLAEINAYGERLSRSLLRTIPRGTYTFIDYLDDDGVGTKQIPLSVRLEVSDGGFLVDFEGSSPQVQGNVNCPLSVAAAAVFYVFRSLLPDYTPACAGTFKPIRLKAPKGSIVNAMRPAAVAAGNVETSTRIVDTLLGALAQAVPDRIASASQGTMNNVAMGNHKVNKPWDYYETLAGGMGAHSRADGLSAVHSHMTNTLNTPIESVEMHFPVRINKYEVRRGSGGKGLRRGGDGLIRQFEFLEPADVTLLTDRRVNAPWGLRGGEPGACGNNYLDGQKLPGKCQLRVSAGEILRIETPGGGGYGKIK